MSIQMEQLSLYSLIRSAINNVDSIEQLLRQFPELAEQCIATAVSQLTAKSANTKTLYHYLIELWTKPFALLMQFIARTDCVPQVQHALLSLADNAQSEIGNINYRVHQLKSNDAAFYTLSNWSSLEALNAHLNRVNIPAEYLVADPTHTRASMLSRPNINKTTTVRPTVTLIPFFTIESDQIDAVRHAHLSMVETTRTEPGCIDYDLYQSLDDAAVMFFYENWSDQDALSKHMNTENFFRLVRGQVDPRLVVPWTALSMTPIDNEKVREQYWPALKPVGQHSAANMRAEKISDTDYLLVFSTGDEVMSGLLHFATEFKIGSARISAIGALSHARVGWYDPTVRMYKINYIDQQSELTSLIGNITTFNGKPALHLHANVTDHDGLARGGHALELFVNPTVEMFVTAEKIPLFKEITTSGIPKIIIP